jgi:hypothetical protein
VAPQLYFEPDSIRFFFFLALQYRPCPLRAPAFVSFIDSEGIRHSVEVTASTLYEE